MATLDDFLYFAKIVEHSGFAQAARSLGIPKSRLSRHLASLETRLGVRLVNRSTRRFAVTEVGQAVYRHASAMLSEADAAVEAVEFARAAPRGLIKVSCPVDIAQTTLARLLPEFLTRYPDVRISLHATNRRVDVLQEGFDLALRVRTRPSGEDGLVMRKFGEACERLVATPAFLAAAGRPERPEDLAKRATLGFQSDGEPEVWELTDANGRTVRVEHQPRVACHDFVLLRAAVLADLGIALLPQSIVRADLQSGSLEPVLPEWTLPLGTFHGVFPSRRGLLPSVRAFIDFLAERM